MQEVKIGDKFVKMGKRKDIYTVTDKHTTTNSRGEVVKDIWVAQTEFMGQIITDYDVPDSMVRLGRSKVQCN